MFIASDQPRDIRQLIEAYPEFTELYREVFHFRYHKKELVSMFSEALRILDANTTQYMIEVQQAQIEALQEENSDTVAWIRFDEPAVISYPVVKGMDNDLYLTKTFSASDNKLGAIFMDYRNASSFSDRNTIIYGHNLKVGGEMFSQLNAYGDEAFYKEHPYFYIYTPDGKTRTYQVFVAGVVSDQAENYTLDICMPRL